MTRLLVFVAEAPMPWLRLSDDGIAARGDDASVLSAGEDAAVIAVVPGADIVLHWIELPRLAPAQAAAAARELAADVAAGPITDTHVALGPAGTDGKRVLALVDNGRMHGWMERLAALGLDPDHIVPLPLLLPVGDGVTVLAADGRVNARAPHLAFAAEPALAALLLEGHEQHGIDLHDFEAALPAQLADLPLDLRQGRFARRQSWAPARARLRRLALLAAAAALLWLVSAGLQLFERQRAATAAEAQLAEAAAAALPRGTAVSDPVGQVAARLAALGGGDRGFSVLATRLMAALRDRPAVALRSLQYTSAGGLTAVVEAPGADDGAALARALAEAGVVASIANPRLDGDRHVVDLTMRGQ
jgi:general secretion pathway protein L